MLGASPADELAVPIKRLRARAVTVAPTARIEPRIDGLVTTYFEWLGAGLYMPDYRSGSMHGAAQLLEALYYGYSDKAVFLRLDLSEGFRKDHPEFEVRVIVNGESRARLHALIGANTVRRTEFWRGEEQLLVPLGTGAQVQVAFGRVLEMRLDYPLLGVAPHEPIRLQVSIWAEGLPLQMVPQEGWLTLEITEDLVSW